MFKPFPAFLSLLILSVEPVRAIDPFISPAIVTENTPAADIDRSIRQVTVRITSDRNRGSGTIIGKNGDNYLVITNAHVIRGATNLQVETHDGQIRSARILPNSLSGDRDLALVEFRDPRAYSIAKISAIPLDAGIEITTAGYSAETGRYTRDDGKIERVSDRPLQEGYSIGYSGEVVQGMSGGGIFYEDELIGINGRSAYPILPDYTYEDGARPTSAEIQKMRAVNWGIPINTLLTYIQSDILTAYRLPLPKYDPSIANPAYTGYIAELEKKARGFTVRIERRENGSGVMIANGSGVIIAREGKIYTVLTADHVLCQKSDTDTRACIDHPYTVTTSDGKTISLDKKTIIRQEGVDLAVFTFESNENYPIAEIANYSPDRESPVFVAGFPKIADKQARWLFSGGAIKNQEEGILFTRQSDFTINQSGASPGVSSLSGGYDMVYTSITFGGMSGGPVLNAAGQVIGIHGRSEGVAKGEKYKIQLGFSLGIPISSFIGLQEKFRVKLSSLVTVQPRLTAQQREEIDRALVNVEIPETNAPAGTWIERGNQLWRLKKDDRALQAFDRAIQLNDPEYTYLAWYGKALVYRGKYKNREAIEAIEKASATLPARERGSEFHAEILNYRGVIYREMNQYEKAVTSFEEGIKIYPRNPNYYNSLFVGLHAIKRYDRALEAINRAIEIAPRSAWYNNRGNLYQTQKKWDLALADYQRALALNPNNVRTYIARADVYKERKEWNLSLADLNRAIEIDANFSIAYARRGDFYVARKEWDLALADYNKAITINPNDPNTYFYRGFFYFSQRKQELAIADFTKEIEINPYDVIAYVMRGFVYASMKKWDLALGDYNRAIELDPNLSFAYSSRGQLYTERREWNLALADYNKAIELDRNNAQSYDSRGSFYVQQEKWDLALADFNQAIELGHFSSYASRGGVYVRQEKWDLALADFNQAIELSPNPEFAYGFRALLYQAQKKWDLALADYSQAIRINPYFGLAYQYRGNLYRNQNQLDLALADYNRAIELDSYDAVTYYNRGEIYRQQQKWDLALSDYSRAIEFDPNYAFAYTRRYEIYSQQKQWELAVADITKFIELTGKAEGYFLRGAIYLQWQKLDLALADFNQAIELKADNASFYSVRGLLYYQTQKWDLALQDFDRAIALAPNNANFYNVRGEIYKRQKRYPEALQDYQKALEFNEKNLAAITNIGLIHYEQGDLNSARTQFEKGLEIEPKFAGNQLALAVTLYRQGDTGKAIALARSALKIDPEFAKVETLQKNLWGEKIIADARELLSRL